MNRRTAVPRVLLLTAIAAAAAGCAGTSTKTVAGPAVTVTTTATVPGPVVTTRVPVPGPTKTVHKTVYQPAASGPAGTTLGTWSGSGNEVTPGFNVPASGNIIVSWSYYGNSDCSLGSCQATNFSISNTNQNGLSGNLPNDIATSGSGSTEITGDSGVESFNVQAAGHWTITAKSAQ